MGAWVRRRWFVLLLLLGLAAAVLWSDSLRPFTTRLPLRGIIAVSLLLTSLSLQGSQLLRAMTRLPAILWGLLISFGLLPMIGLLLAPLLSSLDVRIGLLIILSVPCTLSSAVLWTRQAGGDDAVALILVVLTNCTAWVISPLWLGSWGPTGVAVDMPQMMRSLVLILVVPVCLGQVLRLNVRIGRLMLDHRTPISAFARVLVLAVLIAAAVDATYPLESITILQLLQITTVCIVVHLIGLMLGLVVGKLFRLSRTDRIAVAFAGSQKTLPVGLYLFATYYRQDYPLAILPLLLYHASQLLVDTLVADYLHAS